METLADTLGAHDVAGVVAAVNAVIPHPGGRGRGMDELTVAHVDADMGDGQSAAGAVIVPVEEENQVAGLHRSGGHEIAAVIVLAGGAAGNGMAQLPVDVVDQAGAIDTVGAGAAVGIPAAHQLPGHGGGGIAREAHNHLVENLYISFLQHD